MSHFGDPTFGYHVAAAQLWGTVALRMANAEGLQLDYRDYAAQIRDYFTESMKTAKRRNLASTINEKAMRRAIESFAEEADRIERSKRETLAESNPAATKQMSAAYAPWQNSSELTTR